MKSEETIFFVTNPKMCIFQMQHECQTFPFIISLLTGLDLVYEAFSCQSFSESFSPTICHRHREILWFEKLHKKNCHRVNYFVFATLHNAGCRHCSLNRCQNQVKKVSERLSQVSVAILRNMLSLAASMPTMKTCRSLIRRHVNVNNNKSRARRKEKESKKIAHLRFDCNLSLA